MKILTVAVLNASVNTIDVSGPEFSGAAVPGEHFVPSGGIV